MKIAQKIIALILVCVISLALPLSSGALSLNDGIAQLKNQFLPGEGPVSGDYSIDYRYFSPVKENDTQKYPLVVWLHGMGDGQSEGDQVEKSNIAYWASDEFQARFQPSGGAFILAARSREENGISWENSMIEPLYGAIFDFITRNSENIDISRIYVGGYSMGGKMTLKMAIAYPEMFAAIFPICPAWSPSSDLTAKLADTPVWLTSSTLDPLVNYHFSVSPTWDSIISNSNVPEKCRFSTMTTVCYPDGSQTSSSHHTWFAVNYDMFSTENGDYPYMTTVNGLGENVTLTYPDGMISWLSQHTSAYDGTMTDGTGNITPEDKTDNIIAVNSILDFFVLLFKAIISLIQGK